MNWILWAEYTLGDMFLVPYVTANHSGASVNKSIAKCYCFHQINKITMMRYLFICLMSDKVLETLKYISMVNYLSPPIYLKSAFRQLSKYADTFFKVVIAS